MLTAILVLFLPVEFSVNKSLQSSRRRRLQGSRTVARLQRDPKMALDQRALTAAGLEGHLLERLFKLIKPDLRYIVSFCPSCSRSWIFKEQIL